MSAVNTVIVAPTGTQKASTGDVPRRPAQASPQVGRSPLERRARSAADSGAKAESGSEAARKGTMLFRSTGLGKAELIAEVVSVRRQGDYLIMEMQTTEPVRWRIRGGLSRRDLWTILKATLKPSILPYLLNPFGWLKKEAAHPGDF